MKCLIVVPPFTGHINPTRGVGAHLLEAGHDVAWCGFPSVLEGLPAGAQLFDVDAADARGLSRETLEESRTLKGLRSVKFFFEQVLTPLVGVMLPGVERAVETFRPDVLFVDQQALAGVVVARRRNLPWVTSCTTTAGLTDPLEALPKIAAWERAQYDALQVAHGLEPQPRPGLSPHGVVVYSARELAGVAPSERVHFVGPITSARPPVPFPWEQLEDGPSVLVSLGTVSHDRGESFYRAVVEGLGDTELQVVLVAPESLVGRVPDNIIRRDFVPQIEILARVDAVVSHGGHNTVVETLAAGLPLVVAPIRDDQPVVASQVVAAGAGVRVKFGRVRGEKLYRSVRTVLDEPEYRRSAEAIQRALRSGGGPSEAARVLTGVASGVR